MSDKKKINCGIVMPISSIDGCSKDHWVEVKNIISESLFDDDKYAIESTLVSDAENIGVIQRRIVRKLYNCDVVVCDVSCRNPNVMFELGMRLAFDKPTIIIKDDNTAYSFDTGIIEHLEYPRDLRFGKIVEFKKKLRKKVLTTYNYLEENPDQSVFLKNFGQFKVGNIQTEEVTADKAIMKSIQELQQEVRLIRKNGYDRKDTKEIIIPFELETKIKRFLQKKADEQGIFIIENLIAKNENLYNEIVEYCNPGKYFSEEDFSVVYNKILRNFELDLPF